MQGLLLPLLPTALELLVASGPQTGPETLTDVLVLANQLVLRYEHRIVVIMQRSAGGSRGQQGAA